MSVERKDVYLISRNSNLTEKKIDELLKTSVYNEQNKWINFVQLILLSLGIGFFSIGVVFFFAYNWENLDKFIKFGIVEILVLVSTILFFVPKFSQLTKYILLTAAWVFVGALLAVYGQIYQTGANAYDFFLAWTLLTTLWVLVSNFPPLWLLHIVLLNITMYFYIQQVLGNWSGISICALSFAVNATLVFVFKLLSKFINSLSIPDWFIYTLSFVAVVFSTIGICIGIFEKYQFITLVLLVLTLLVYSIGIVYGLKTKSRFFLSLIAVSVVSIISTYLAKVSDSEWMILLIAVFIISSITFIVKKIISIK